MDLTYSYKLSTHTAQQNRRTHSRYKSQYGMYVVLVYLKSTSHTRMVRKTTAAVPDTWRLVPGIFIPHVVPSTYEYVRQIYTAHTTHTTHLTYEYEYKKCVSVLPSNLQEENHGSSLPHQCRQNMCYVRRPYRNCQVDDITLPVVSP